MSINRVILTGRLTKDIEIKATASGTNLASFTVAVDGFGRDQNNQPINQASFINCVAFNKQAQFLDAYCKKGTLVAVEGRLQTRSYDRKDGTKAYVTEVIVDKVENLSPKDSSQKDNGFSMNESESSGEETQSLSFSDDDLPF